MDEEGYFIKVLNFVFLQGVCFVSTQREFFNSSFLTLKLEILAYYDKVFSTLWSIISS